MSFTFTCFAVPGQRGGQRHHNSLASKVNAAIASFPASSVPVQHPKPFKSRQSSESNLASRVSSKLEDGDIRGAIRLAASDDILAPFDDVTAEVLRSKHPHRAIIFLPTRRQHRPTIPVCYYCKPTSLRPSNHSCLVQPAALMGYDLSI